MAKIRFQHGEHFEHKGRTFRVQFEHDQDHGAPWKEHDGHGPVSEWTTRDKRPGEWLLIADRSSKRYYDFAEAVKIARRDQWGVEGGQLPNETAGEYAVRAVTKDFDYLRGWANSEWYYVGVIVTELDADGDEGDTESLWGCEDLNDYPSTVVLELAEALIGRGPAPTTAAEMEARRERAEATAAAALAELRESALNLWQTLAAQRIGRQSVQKRLSFVLGQLARIEARQVALLARIDAGDALTDPAEGGECAPGCASRVPFGQCTCGRFERQQAIEAAIEAEGTPGS